MTTRWYQISLAIVSFALIGCDRQAPSSVQSDTQAKALIVLVHGWSCDSSYWSEQVPTLSARYAVATVDLAGHGDSGSQRQDWSMAAFGGDVARVVSALPEYRKVVLVGHSMGGPVVVEAARQLGGRVVGLIGIDTLRDVGVPRRSAEAIATLLAPFEKDYVGTTRAFVSANFFTPASDPALVKKIADDMAAAPPEIALPAMRELLAWEAEVPLSEAGLPLVLINAALPPTETATVAALPPSFTLIARRGAGHFLMIEDAPSINPILLREVESLLAD